MTRKVRRSWFPPLLIGAAAAIAAEVAVALLLYAGPGLMRSLTTLLGVEAASLAAGLQIAPAHTPTLLDSVRRRWLFCLGAFMAAALYGTAWSLFEGLGVSRLGQGAGLALLAGLPMFGCGALLGALASVSVAEGSGRLRGPSAPAALGAALGFVVTGILLPRAPVPASLLVGCLVLLSGGGMVYGAVLSALAEAGAQGASQSPVNEAVATLPDDGGAEAAADGSAGGDDRSEVASVVSSDAPPQ